ncbi:MAG: ADP-ribosylation factor-like protein [Candidatus Hodarchaeales archaeon]|jgi:GTPase SAR1 family protein
MSQLPQKVLFMGLGASGKSSIRSVAFEGKNPEEVQDYQATINYVRSTKNFIDSSFQIFDCGGQETFISSFIGDQAEFIFSNVSIFIWVVDMSNYEQLSTSKFYFDHGISRMNEYSPDGTVFCLFHKRDLVLPEMQDQTFETMKTFFELSSPFEIQFRTTSIFDRSVYQIIGEMLQTLIVKTTKALTVSEAIQEFLKQNDDFSGIIICNEEGVPLFQEGKLPDSYILPANLSLANYGKIKSEFTTLGTYKNTMEFDEYILFFQKLKKELLFIGVAEKTGSTQFTLVKMDKIAEIINTLI